LEWLNVYYGDLSKSIIIDAAMGMLSM